MFWCVCGSTMSYTIYGAAGGQGGYSTGRNTFDYRGGPDERGVSVDPQSYGSGPVQVFDTQDVDPAYTADASSGTFSYGGNQTQSPEYYFQSLQNQLVQTTAVLKQLHEVVTKNDDAVKQNQLRLSQLEQELRNMIPAMQRIMRNLPQ